MEWVTVYEAGRFNGIIEFKIGIPVLIIGVLAMMLYVSICRDEKKDQMNARLGNHLKMVLFSECFMTQTIIMTTIIKSMTSSASTF